MMKILFICTHNRCRSILAEAVSNHLSKGHYLSQRIEARSAGSQPAGEVHPLSLKYLNEADIPTQGLHSKYWDEQAQNEQGDNNEIWQPDVVITVCDSAAAEVCPLWFGDALKIHWGLRDPSSVQGNEEETAQAFHYTLAILSKRIDALLETVEKHDKTSLETLFNRIGELS